MSKKIATLVICFFLLTTASYAMEDIVWEEYIKAKKQYQTALAELLLRQLPEAEEIIEVQRDIQFNMIEMRSEKFYFILKNYPEKLVADQGISPWSNFEWSEEHEKELIRTNEKYRQLKDEYGAMKKINQGHRQWSIVRERFPLIRETDEYQLLHKALLSSLAEIDEKLKNR